MEPNDIAKVITEDIDGGIVPENNMTATRIETHKYVDEFFDLANEFDLNKNKRGLLQKMVVIKEKADAQMVDTLRIFFRKIKSEE